MASLAEREGLRGRVQCIYIDPPYGIKFNSNFQWSTTSRDVKDGNPGHITREPEQVKAFRDTWRDGIHSYLTYLRDRLTVARDLLADSGSIFVQIGDENVHRVRALMDEVFGDDNFVLLITALKTTSATSEFLAGVTDHVLFYGKKHGALKYRGLFNFKALGAEGTTQYRFVTQRETGDYMRLTESEIKSGRIADGWAIFAPDNLTSQKPPGDFPFKERGTTFRPGKGFWKTHERGFWRLSQATRLHPIGNTLIYRRFLSDFAVYPISNIWRDVLMTGFSEDKLYVVQSSSKIVERCILMTTDPGDLVLDPTCGSGTTAYVAEQWGRRWITIDTSRVALVLARVRIMGARYPWYILADSPKGQRKEAEVSRTAPKEAPTRGDIRHGFVYERVPHITLKSIANNAEIDVIWERWQAELEPLRAALNAALGRSSSSPQGLTRGSAGGREDVDGRDKHGHDVRRHAACHHDLRAWEEWEIPREAGTPWDGKTAEIFYKLKSEQEKDHKGDRSLIRKYIDTINHNLERSLTLDALPDRPVDSWPEAATELHARWWELRIARQKEIDASIAAKAEVEYLYDKPYVDDSRVRVAGPFTVETLSPHRVLAVSHDDELIDVADAAEGRRAAPERGPDEADFAEVILENLKTSGVQQAHKEGRITFTALTGWPGEFICAEARFMEGDEEAGSAEGATGKAREKRAGIFIGPEFGTVARPDLVAAAREAGDAGFDALIACAFNYDAHSAEFDKLGRIPVLKARMNADLHMAGELKNTGKGNLFVIFGEPDIDIEDAGEGQIRVKINGVDVFHPQTGEIASSGPEGIACWFIDTDYNEESFFVRHAYFLGANDPYKALKTTLRAEIDEDAWASLNSDTSRPFDKPSTGRIAVKVINHLGDEVMKVFAVR
ncbi:MAG: site-specific DNA-methyltransferase [Rhodoplanes sp.]